jgi:prepilin-type processing-associated H-X9-DG protein
VLNYESQWSIFPPSSTTLPGVQVTSFDGATRRENWAILVLPFLEQQALWEKFALSKPITDEANATPRATPLAVMRCPTDSYNRQPFMGTQGSETSSFGDNWARGNYAANADLGFPYISTTYERWAGSADSAAWKDSNLRGVMGNNVAITMAQVRDGTSNTILLGEIRAGITPYDSRGVWALGGACSSALWAHGGMYTMYGDDGGPNYQHVSADNLMNCLQIREALGGGGALARAGMPCYGPEANDEQTARSLHAGGVHVCFADGSVRWISDYIQTYPSSPEKMSVWDRLVVSADGFPVDASQF